MLTCPLQHLAQDFTNKDIQIPSAAVYAARGNTWSNFVNYADTKTLYEWYEDSISAFEITDEYGNHEAPICSCEMVGVLCGCI